MQWKSAKGRQGGRRLGFRQASHGRRHGGRQGRGDNRGGAVTVTFTRKLNGALAEGKAVPVGGRHPHRPCHGPFPPCVARLHARHRRRRRHQGCQAVSRAPGRSADSSASSRQPERRGFPAFSLGGLNMSDPSSRRNFLRGRVSVRCTAAPAMGATGGGLYPAVHSLRRLRARLPDPHHPSGRWRLPHRRLCAR